MSKLYRCSQAGLSLGLAALIAVSFAACNVNVDKKNGEEAKKVDISTPFGELKVNKEADGRDTGLSVYPNSREKKEDNSNDKKSANVNLSFGNFGLKVVAATYEVDDSPAKVMSFYRNELGKYGKILECKGGSIGNVKVDKSSKDDKELKCDSHGDSDVTELKVGTEDLQHVVAVKPSGKGSEYSLVYIRMHGSEKEPI
jgi:hypothetical protein